MTGASQGIGAGIVKRFVERGFNVVANSRKVSQSTEVAASDHVALVDGHIGEPPTAAKIAETALTRFKSIDVLVNNAGIFFTKPFTDYTAEDVKSLVSTNVEGFLYVTQLSIKQMVAERPYHIAGILRLLPGGEGVAKARKLASEAALKSGVKRAKDPTPASRLRSSQVKKAPCRLSRRRHKIQGNALQRSRSWRTNNRRRPVCGTSRIPDGWLGLFSKPTYCLST